jgi:ParB family chromosome partitioning protein
LSKRRGLGKGLQALIPVAKEVPRDSQEGLLEIDIDSIRPARRQARQLFDQEKLDGLADSIREHGVIQPVLVRKLADGGYELIAGERRWRACKSLGLKTIAAFVKDCPDLEAAAASLIETRPARGPQSLGGGLGIPPVNGGICPDPGRGIG